MPGPRGVSAPGRVPGPGWRLLRGVPAPGMPGPGGCGIPACTEADPPPLNRMTDRQV